MEAERPNWRMEERGGEGKRGKQMLLLLLVVFLSQVGQRSCCNETKEEGGEGAGEEEGPKLVWNTTLTYNT